MTDNLIKDILQWDVKSWSKALLYWEENIDWKNVNNCLELGGREGGLSLWLCLKGKHTICSDLENVKATSEKLHSHYDIKNYIEYKDIDASNIPFENQFDIIVFKSIIGGIGRKDNTGLQQKVFDEIYKVLKPGGKLLFAENLIASPLHQKIRGLNKWGNYWKYVSMDDLNNYLLKFSSVTIKTTGVLAAFGRNEKQRNFLAALDTLILNKICPNSWKYISFGIAQK